MKEFFINSSIDNQKLFCVDFSEKVTKPRFVVQLIHGMQEHIKRYETFANFLTNNGIKVIGMDTRGHGETGRLMKFMGHLSDENGNEKVVEDVNDLNKYIKTNFKDAKVIILGHSMGSLILRNYINKYSENIDGAIVCGSTGLADINVNLGYLLAKHYVRRYGKRGKSPFLNVLPFKNNNKYIKEPKTVFDWLTRDESISLAYKKDSKCGFLCTNQFYIDLLKLVKNMSKKKNLLDVKNKKLPIYFISGEMDPVGKYGKGVKKSVDFYHKAKFENISLSLYPEMRHEILNEIDKEVVYNDILEFVKKI
ncbi:alpha/beta fold hydrolase [Mycoplasma sp. Mirounga ES2805-ORL]|uniref:alpha/beta fold hydrolase n=1 Tax=Mycoplasma sp. Mirounga ES2805-ORL TaxID=754514 RepID=UPI00197B7F49|nr:alpha/beta hydrolase [Mycoplasma sp. Mirounga ES2805-ORL]QSF13925.1 alpha/beta fold hydrolase [Mycoplasma sp. Mirounga ES2805-ORL]